MPIAGKIAISIVGLVLMVLVMNVSAARRAGTWQDYISLRAGEYLFRSDGTPKSGYRIFVFIWFAFCLTLLWLFG